MFWFIARCDWNIDLFWEYDESITFFSKNPHEWIILYSHIQKLAILLLHIFSSVSELMF